MNVEELIERCGERMGVQRVFGEPIERDKVTVIPVAVVMGGAGGGPAPAEGDCCGENSGDEHDLGSGKGCRKSCSEGAGFGMCARGIGVYTIQDGNVRFVPAVDMVALGLIGLAFTTVTGRMLSRRRRRR